MKFFDWYIQKGSWAYIEYEHVSALLSLCPCSSVFSPYQHDKSSYCRDTGEFFVFSESLPSEEQLTYLRMKYPDLRYAVVEYSSIDEYAESIGTRHIPLNELHAEL